MTANSTSPSARNETGPLGMPGSDEYHQHWLDASALACELGSASLADDILRLMARKGMTIAEIGHAMTRRTER